MKGTRLRTVAAILAGMLAGGSLMAVAWAHGGDASLVHSCVNKTSGAVRIVAASVRCKSWERPLDWGIQGPQGIQGLEGPPAELPPGTITGAHRLASTIACPDFSAGTWPVYCPDGEVVLNGSAYIDTTVGGTAPLAVSREVGSDGFHQYMEIIWDNYVGLVERGLRLLGHDVRKGVRLTQPASCDANSGREQRHTLEGASPGVTVLGVAVNRGTAAVQSRQ